MVEVFGPVENVTIIKNHQTNKSKGCGFVKFVYREDAMDAFAVTILSLFNSFSFSILLFYSIHSFVDSFHSLWLSLQVRLTGV
jgi:hypothetical protein